MGKRILIIDDEPDLIALLRANLKSEDFEVESAKDGETGLRLAMKDPPHVVVLDLMLPGIDGLEVCRRLRNNPRTADLPIIMLTAKAAEVDRIVGLRVGADDYVTKPFSPKELVARVQALLRRATKPKASTSVIRIGDLLLDLDRHEVTSAGKRVDLTMTEFRILQYLMENAGRLCPRGDILEGALGSSADSVSRAIDVHILSIRRKLGAAGGAIETVRNGGYRLRED